MQTKKIQNSKKSTSSTQRKLKLLAYKKLEKTLKTNKSFIKHFSNQVIKKFDCLLVEQKLQNHLKTPSTNFEQKYIHIFEEIILYFKQTISFSGVLALFIQKIFKGKLEIKIKNLKNSDQKIESKNFFQKSKVFYHLFNCDVLVDDKIIAIFEVRGVSKRCVKNFVACRLLKGFSSFFFKYLVWVFSGIEKDKIKVGKEKENDKGDNLGDDDNKKNKNKNNLKLEENRDDDIDSSKIEESIKNSKLNEKTLQHSKQKESLKNSEIDNLETSKYEEILENSKSESSQKKNSSIKIESLNNNFFLHDFISEKSLHPANKKPPRKKKIYKIFNFKTLPIYEDSDNQKEQIEWIRENLQNNNAKNFYKKIINKKFNDSDLIDLLKKLKIENEITLITENPKFIKFEKNVKEFENLLLQQMDIFIAVLKYFLKFENQKLKSLEKKKKIKKTNLI